MALTTTVTETTDVVIAPKLLKQLRVQVAAYQQLIDQRKILETKIDTVKETIEDIREQTDEISVSVDGTMITRVVPVRSVLDKKKLIALGCAAAWLEEATKLVPSKPYTKISLAHDADEDDAP